MVEREKEILHINSKNQSLGSSVRQKGDGGVSFGQKKGFQEPSHTLNTKNFGHLYFGHFNFGQNLSAISPKWLILS